jgi:peptidylprolyl isomerase
MTQAKQGDRVRVNYTGKLADGTVFDSSDCVDDGCGCASGPLEFTIGAGEVIPGFDAAVLGMSIGESRNVVIPVKEAYGERLEEMVAEIPKSDLPEGLVPELGAHLEVAHESGQVFQVLITDVTDSHITIDANHPLAGRELTFDISLVEIC